MSTDTSETTNTSATTETTNTTEPAANSNQQEQEIQCTLVKNH